MDAASKTILILGGNGFIGCEIVEHLLGSNQDYKLVLLNRGNWSDWDSATRIKPRIYENIIWDRRTDSIKFCLAKYLNNADFCFHAIIDLSAYKKKDIQNVLNEIPHHKFRLYILISTDSVYEVCLPRNEDCFVETDSIRPASESEQSRLKHMDSYGHHKLRY